MSFLPTYLCANYVTDREPAIGKPSPTINDSFDEKNWSIQKKKYKMVKQVYRVKKDRRLNKNWDLTLDKEKPTVEQTSASSIDQIVPNSNPASNNLAEQRSSLAGGQGKKKKADSKSSGLTGAPSKSENSSRSKTRPSFKEFLAKYVKEGIAQR